MSTSEERTGQRIRELRRQQDRSQAELLEPGLLSAGYLSLIESGQRRPSSEVLRHIADRLGTTPEYLATGKQPDDWLENEQQLAFGETTLHNGTAAEALALFDAVLVRLDNGVRGSGPHGSAQAGIRARARLGRARALELSGRTEEALEAFDELWKATRPETAEWAERAVDMMRCAVNAGDYAYSVDIGERAMATFESLGLEWTDAAIRLGVSLGDRYYLRGDLVQATRLLERMIKVSEEAGSRLGLASAYYNAAAVAHDRGRQADAILLTERALALFEETERDRNRANLRVRYGAMLGKSAAKAKQGRKILLQAHKEILEYGSTGEVSWCEQHLAEAELELDDPDAALTWARSAYDRATSASSPERIASACVTYALTLLRKRRRAKAAERAAEAETALQQATVGFEVTAIWTRLAALYEDLGDTAGALRSYKRGLAAIGHTVERRI